MFKKVAIVGVGLIGGSLGLAIKKNKLAKFVVGVCRRKSSARDSVSFGAVDMATLDLKKGVSGADLVVLCGPVTVIASQLKSLSMYISKNTLVIDVGSSKSLIEAAAKKHLRRGTFVGCHPMAGLEKKGVRFADGSLFKGAVCFMTRRHKKIEALWKRIGCHPVFIDAQHHDTWVAQFSHLPHVLSFALFASLRPGGHKARPYGVNPSLRDLARISKSDPGLWADILFSNRSEVLDATTRFEQDLRAFKTALRRRRPRQLAALIAGANRVSHRLTPNAR